MRIAVTVVAIIVAGQVAAQMPDFSTREMCLRELRGALEKAEVTPRYFEAMAAAVEESPATDTEAAARAADALRRESQARIDYADALLNVCQSYE